MKIVKTVALVGALWAGTATAEECTHLWDLSQIGTDPAAKKALSGDTNAAYPILSFRGNPRIRYVIRGAFPHARFMSIETVRGERHLKIDSLFDRDIVPDEGSLNPYIEGAPLDAMRRSYTIDVVPEGVERRLARNLLTLPNNRLHQAFMMRIYAPVDGSSISTADIPRIFAYDAYSEQPVACPRAIRHNPYNHFPQFLARVFPRQPDIEFRNADIPWGPNSAIAQYLYAVNPMRAGREVAVVRFKAPQYADTQQGVGPFPRVNEVRYWSLCVHNFAKNETLGCMPDHLALPDADGFVTLVVGQGAAFRAAAAARGHYLVEDNRAWNQSAVQFAYRNLLPSDSFQSELMYQGEYRPAGSICSTKAYLEGSCHN